MSYLVDLSPGKQKDALDWLHLLSERPRSRSIHTLRLCRTPEFPTSPHIVVLTMHDSSMFTLKRAIVSDGSSDYAITLESAQVSPPVPLIELKFANSGINLAFILAICQNYDPSKLHDISSQPERFNNLFPFALTAVAARSSVTIPLVPDGLISNTHLVSAWNTLCDPAKKHKLFWEDKIKPVVDSEIRGLIRKVAIDKIKQLDSGMEDTAAFDVAWTEASSEWPILPQPEQRHELWARCWHENWGPEAAKVPRHYTTRFLLDLDFEDAALATSPDMLQTGIMCFSESCDVQELAEKALRRANQFDALALLSKHLTRRLSHLGSGSTHRHLPLWQLGTELAWIGGWGYAQQSSTAPVGYARVAQIQGTTQENVREEVNRLVGVIWDLLEWENKLDTWAEDAWSRYENKRCQWLGSHWPSRKQKIKDAFTSTWKGTWKKTWMSTCIQFWEGSWKDGHIMYTSGTFDDDAAGLGYIQDHLQGQDSYPKIMHKLYSVFKALDRLNRVRQDSNFATHEQLKVVMFDQVFIKVTNKQNRGASSSSKAQPSPITHTQLQAYIRNPLQKPPSPDVYHNPAEWLLFQIKNGFRADKAPLYLSDDVRILPQLWELATQAP
ncbi:hypothetical protein FRC10_004214 [Ceratobasidium sp. 414]|nr:hypothetical protein FRC10_004214 [Ceratobasidium sp. 414]